MSEYPQKDFYRLSEVCQYTDTQPYVLRFWESEFPQLNPGESGSGRRMYSRSDIDLVERIKQLLYEEEYTLAEARKKLEQDRSGKGRGKRVPNADAKTKASRKHTDAPSPAPTARPQKEVAARRIATALPPREIPEPDVPEVETVSRGRYEDAVDEIDHLRLQLKEAEKHRRKAESALEEANAETERQRDRNRRALSRLENLLKGLESRA